MQRIIVFILLSFWVTSACFSQETGDEMWNRQAKDKQNNPFEGNQNAKHLPEPHDDPFTQDVPIDGGLGVLLVAGALYGRKQIAQRKKMRSKEQ